MAFTTETIRNIAVAGHVGTGKTTLVENILFNCGVIPKAETVESGKTLSDYTDEEIERQISIHTTLSHVEWENVKINLLDTPGSSDFIGEVVAAFRAAESGLILVGARAGVQIETIKLWRRLDNRNMPRLIFVNKMEKERAEFKKTLDDLSDKFDATFIPVTIPIGEGMDYKGVVNLIENKAYMIPDPTKKEIAIDIPEEMLDTVEEYRMGLIESAAEGKDELMEKYFAEETLSSDEIREGLIEGLKTNKIVPVLCGSGLVNSGVISLLNFCAHITPSPIALKEIAIESEGEEAKEAEVAVDSESPVSAFVYKTSIDQFSGKLSFVKVVTGVLTSDTDLLNAKEQNKERVSKLYTATGKKLDEIKELQAGDLGIITKLQSVSTNDTLCSPDKVVLFKPLDLPNPVYSVAVNAASKKDEDKLNQSMQRVAEEDRTFQINFNPETKETVISAMGELHVNMVLEKIKENQKIEVETKTPKVAYRETINKSADAQYRHKKQSGGHGQFGEVVIKINPIERGEQYKFENAIKGGAVSKGYIPGIEKGLHEAMESGVLAGYPVVDVGITLVDGKEHPVDSSEMSFKLAAKGALKDAISKASPVLLEPVMNLRVFVDDQYLGDVLSDLSSRRGRVLGQNPIGGGIQEISAQVPQAELLRYAIDLRSITSGTASFEMDFDHYNPISGKIAENVIAASQASKEAEE